MDTVSRRLGWVNQFELDVSLFGYFNVIRAQEWRLFQPVPLSPGLQSGSSRSRTDTPTSSRPSIHRWRAASAITVFCKVHTVEAKWNPFIALPGAGNLPNVAGRELRQEPKVQP